MTRIQTSWLVPELAPRPPPADLCCTVKPGAPSPPSSSSVSAKVNGAGLDVLLSMLLVAVACMLLVDVYMTLELELELEVESAEALDSSATDVDVSSVVSGANDEDAELLDELVAIVAVRVGGLVEGGMLVVTTGSVDDGKGVDAGPVSVPLVLELAVAVDEDMDVECIELEDEGVDEDMTVEMPDVVTGLELMVSVAASAGVAVRAVWRCGCMHAGAAACMRTCGAHQRCRGDVRGDSGQGGACHARAHDSRLGQRCRRGMQVP